MENTEAWLFFGGNSGDLGLYAALETALLAAFPAMKIKTQKSQISFYGRRLFACVSKLRVKKKSELPESWVTLTIGLPAPLDSPRVAAKTEPYPNRWTHHIVLTSPTELDEELMDWLREAWSFAEVK